MMSLKELQAAESAAWDKRRTAERAKESAENAIKMSQLVLARQIGNVMKCQSEWKQLYTDLNTKLKQEGLK